MRFGAIFAILPVVAFGVTVETLPPPQFIDTEVSATHRLEQPAFGLRGLDFRLDFNGTPSNNVEVVLGKDADGDGDLSFQEEGLIMGCECGEWFAKGIGGEIAPVVEGPDTNGYVTAVVDVSIRRHKSDPGWLYDRTWNMMRITLRGVDAADECINLWTRVSGTMILIK